MTASSIQSENRPPPRRWVLRTLVLVGLCWTIMVALPSLTIVRGWLTIPLYVHHKDAHGEVAYVMADGFAYYERLRAAADLYHMDQIEAIYITDERRSAGYDFVAHRSQTRSEQAIGYLGYLGVDQEHVHLIPAREGAAMGSLSEARSFASLHAEQFSRVVVVTSAPHTRRSLMCFRRSLPEQTEVQVYSATSPAHSAEVHMPIWHEYLKLIVYFVVTVREYPQSAVPTRTQAVGRYSSSFSNSGAPVSGASLIGPLATRIAPPLD